MSAELIAGFIENGCAANYEVSSINQALQILLLNIVEIPREAAFLAGKAFQLYRKQGGQKTGVLPDFFIGAHAAVAGSPLLTRDPRRYASYFPTVQLITP